MRNEGLTMQKMTIGQLIAKIETIESERELKRIRKVLKNRLFDVRYADKPKEKAMWLRHMAELRGEKVL
jgi:hypothetical protein